jgi:PAS domain S-box-containing protein
MRISRLASLGDMGDKIDIESDNKPECLCQQDLEHGGARPKYPAFDNELAPALPEIQDLLEAFPCYVLLVDENHLIVQANSAVRSGLGVEPKDIIGKYCPKVIHGLDEPWYACPLEEAVQKSRPIEREAFDKHSGRWIRSAVYPVRGLTTEGSRMFLHLVSDVTDRKQAEEQMKASREQLRNLSRHLESVREEERTNMAREIHDELGSLLTGLKIDLSWLSKRIPREQELSSAKTRIMHELIDEAILTVKKISTELRPGVLDDLGISAAIEWQAQELEKRAEIKVEFTSIPKDIVLDRDRSTALFRICQEALTNVVRHAHATKVQMTLKKEPKKVVLSIRDDGKGIEEEHSSDPRAFGLIGVRERVRSFEGEFNISGSPGKGTLVVVTIPLVKEDTDVAGINR